MANQAKPGTVGVPESAHAYLATQDSPETAPASDHQAGGAVTTVAGHAGPYPTFHGRKVSWFAVAVVIVGVLVGSFGMVLGHGGPEWWLFWTGVGVAVLGLLVATATNIFEDWY
jgi:hypothetical protein